MVKKYNIYNKDDINKDIKNTKNIKKTTDAKTTGHEWDGIEEYSNPDPIWLRILFYMMLFTAMAYWLLYPSWPTPNNEGLLNWSSILELNKDLKTIEIARSKYQDEFDKTSIDDIPKNEKLLKFAFAGGKSAFHNNCAVCHGYGGGGGPGYPNLTAGAWLWGGKLSDIYTTIKYGIRSSDDNTRQSQMAAFGKDKILPQEDIPLLAKYVLTLSADINSNNTQEKVGLNDADYKIAMDLFQNNCATCHEKDGSGNYEFGAPNLRDSIWLYGGSYNEVYDVIYNGREGIMPTWAGKLPDSTIKQLTIYVHQLGGGQ